jgi:hypothetical protein
MEFNFGIPTKRGRKGSSAKEYFTEGAAIVVLANAGPRTAKMIVFNNAACERLELQTGGAVSFDFTKANPVVVNTTSLDLPKGAACELSDRKDIAGVYIKDSKLWSFLVKTYNLDETVDNVFTLGGDVEGDFPATTFSTHTVTQAEDLVIQPAQPLQVVTEDESFNETSQIDDFNS